MIAKDKSDAISKHYESAHTAAMMKAIDEYEREVCSSKRSARAMLKRIGVLDKKGQLSKRCRPGDSSEDVRREMVALYQERNNDDYVCNDPYIADLIKMVDEFGEKASRSQRLAREVLVEAGIVDKSGKLRKRYRP